MKTVKISANNTVSLVDVDFDDFHSIQRAVGGHFETVRADALPLYFNVPGLIMLVDEEGQIKGLPINLFASAMYAWPFPAIAHATNNIAGDAILAKVVGEDIVAPDNPEELKRKILEDFGKHLKEGEDE